MVQKWSDEKVHFAGGDARMKLFSSVMPAGRNFDVAINHHDANSIVGTPAFDVMRAKFYDNNSGMDNNDIHYEFANFIVLCAIFHRELDTFTSESVLQKKASEQLIADKFNGVKATQTWTWTNKATFMTQLYNVIRNVMTSADVNADFAAYDDAVAGTGLGITFVDHVLSLVRGRYNVRQDDVFDSVDGLNPGLDADEINNVLFPEIIDTVIFAFREALRDRFTLPYKTLDQSQHARNFVANVYQKWDSLHEDSQEFYKTFVNLFKKNTAGSFSPVNEAHYQTEALSAKNNPENYRLNLVKEHLGGTVPAFVNLIPLVPDISKNYWQKNHIKNTTFNFPITSKTVLRDLYVRTFTNSPSFDAYINQGFDTIHVNGFEGYKVDQVLRDALRKMKGEVDVQPPTVDCEDCVYDLSLGNIWKRDVNKKLYVEKDGKRIYNDVDDENFQKMLSDKYKCYSTGLFDTTTASGKQQCNNMMYKCILDGKAKDIDACVMEMSNANDFDDAARKEILNHMTPMIARSILSKFGFRTVSRNHPKLGKLKYIESFETWFKEKLNHKLSDKTLVSSFKSNDKITRYLKMCIEFMNNEKNLGILNKNIDMSLVGQMPDKVGITTNEYAAQLGLKPRKEFTLGNQLYSISALQHTLTNPWYQFKKPVMSVNKYGKLRTPFGDYVANGFGTAFPFVQAGGSYQTGGSHAVLNKYANEYSGYGLLKNVYNNLRIQLKNKGVVLTKSDSDKIDKCINNLLILENKILDVLKKISSYNNLLSVYGNDITSQNILSYDDLKTLTDKYSGYMNNLHDGQLSMTKILKNLISESGKDDGDSDAQNLTPMDD